MAHAWEKEGLGRVYVALLLLEFSFIENEGDKVCNADLMGTLHDGFNIVRRELSHINVPLIHPT